MPKRKRAPASGSIERRATRPDGTVALWIFPPTDFRLWKDLCAEPDDFESYDAYVKRVSELKASVEASGTKVIVCDMPVEKMVADLRERGMENTGANRAALLGEWARRSATL
jgi:hypothetical protein